MVMEMMIITRLYPDNASIDLWNSIISALKKYESKDITPLYASQRDDSSFTSIISEAKSPDAVMQMMGSDEVTNIRGIRHSNTTTLAKEVFFPTVSTGKRMRRYHFSIQARPASVRGIHQSLRKEMQTPMASLAYLALSFGEDDIIGSMVAVDYDRAKELLVTNFGNPADIVGYSIARVARSKRLVDDKTWKNIIKKYPHISPENGDSKSQEVDWTLVDEALITGAFKRDIED